MIKIKIEKTKKHEGKVSVLLFFSKEKITDLPENKYSFLKEGEMRLISYKEKDFLLLNIGEKKKWNQRKLILSIRKIVRFLKGNRIESAVFFLDNIVLENESRMIKQIAENILIADYEFNSHKEEPKEKWAKIKEITLSLSSIPRLANNALKEGIIIGNAVNLARDLSNAPGEEITPKKLASLAKKEIGPVKFKTIGRKKLKEMKMGGILGVSKGSNEEPQLIVMEYYGKKNIKKVDAVFVGKGITFDSGGLNIKTNDSMLGMHMDMSGGAAIIATMKALSLMKISINVVGIVPAVENLVSANSLKPGDILKSYSGKTIEVGNTDAEGRIILADALWYGAEKFKPKVIIDVATLTGAAVVALGYRATAIFSNKEGEAINLFYKIGEESGDYVWPLPCWDEYREEIKGSFGDISNIGSLKGAGGAIIGAVFLKSFIKNDLPWIHLDIAPTMTSIEGQGMAKGSTGTGVRYLLEFAQTFKEIEKYYNKY
jgi:leucyl aminopeptidase